MQAGFSGRVDPGAPNLTSRSSSVQRGVPFLGSSREPKGNTVLSQAPSQEAQAGDEIPSKPQELGQAPELAPTSNSSPK